MMNKPNNLPRILNTNPELHELLINVFNDQDAAERWLLRNRKQLCGLRPIDLVDSKPELVISLLTRILTGDFS